MKPPPIELRLTSVAQLFNTLDPSPFRDRDLDTRAEAYLLGRARDLPAGEPVRLVVHLPAAEAATAAGSQLSEIIRQYFAGRGEDERRAIREGLRGGRRALVIGLGLLGTCLMLARFSTGLFGGGPTGQLLGESLVIVGWVALWRPAEIFLYDWIPGARRRDLFDRLAQAEVTLHPSPN